MAQEQWRGPLAQFLADLGRTPPGVLALQADDRRFDRRRQLANKAPVFTAKAAPRDKNKKTLAQKEWTLNDYIEIARELKWIGETAKSVGIVLRDYPNYIHPYKELTHRDVRRRRRPRRPSRSSPRISLRSARRGSTAISALGRSSPSLRLSL
jgi:hypothetical protein